MLFLRCAALVAVVSLLSACAVPLRVSMTPEQRSKLIELNAHVVVVQDEVIAEVKPSQASLAAAGGGLIGAVIGASIDSAVTNSRVKASQQTMGPFYAAIEDVDYRAEFNEAVKRELASYPLKVARVTTTPRALNDVQLNRLRDQLQPGQALLVIYPRYFLTMNFRSLDAETVVSTWIKGGEATPARPVQRAILYYQSPLVGEGDAESIKLWSAQNAALFRSTLRESIAETLKLVLMDQEVAAAPSTKAEDFKTYAFNTGGQLGQLKGQPLKETADRVVILGQDSKLYSLPQSAKTTAMVNK